MTRANCKYCLNMLAFAGGLANRHPRCYAKKFMGSGIQVVPTSIREIGAIIGHSKIKIERREVS